MAASSPTKESAREASAGCSPQAPNASKLKTLSKTDNLTILDPYQLCF
jgi:hypothetical protein